MSQPLDITIVRRARALIADPRNWCRGFGALGPDGRQTDDARKAVQFCAWGALCRASDDLLSDAFKACVAAYAVAARMVPEIDEEGIQVLFDINDAKGGHAAVLALFDAFLEAQP